VSDLELAGARRLDDVFLFVVAFTVGVRRAVDFFEPRAADFEADFDPPLEPVAREGARDRPELERDPVVRDDVLRDPPDGLAPARDLDEEPVRDELFRWRPFRATALEAPLAC
jgi:hypothetical protein